MHRVLTTQLDRKFVLSAAKNKTSGLWKKIIWDWLMDIWRLIKKCETIWLEYSEPNVGKPTGISLVAKGNMNCSLIVCVHHANWPVAKQVV